MSSDIIIIDDIKSKIFTIRGLQVMLDRDLAEMFAVETKALNQAVKRNIDRFPSDFMFKINDDEKNELVTNCYRLENLKHSSSNPNVFTEQGVAMLSSVLRSPVAIKTSIIIMKTFVEMRKFLSYNSDTLSRLNTLEKNQLTFLSKQNDFDNKINYLFKALESKKLTPAQGIFYNGEIFDAYQFVSDLIRTAEKSIILIDNYANDTVLTLMSKRKEGVQVKIYMEKIKESFKLDIEKYNSQYEKIEVKIFKHSHDRFLIIDEKAVYHIGASLKDLGKKWFAFSKLEIPILELLEKM